MKRLFAPGISILNQMRYAAKFLAIGGLLELILIAATFWIVSQLNQNIGENRNRAEAIAANKSVISLINLIQQHRGTSTIYLNGDKSALIKLKQLEEQIVHCLLQRGDECNRADLPIASQRTGRRSNWHRRKPSPKWRAV